MENSTEALLPLEIPIDVSIIKYIVFKTERELEIHCDDNRFESCNSHDLLTFLKENNVDLNQIFEKIQSSPHDLRVCYVLSVIKHSEYFDFKEMQTAMK